MQLCVHALAVNETLYAQMLGASFCTLQDYLIAEGYNEPFLKEGKVLFDAKYFYSQDGVKWVDLVAVDATTSSKAEKFKVALSGDPAKVRMGCRGLQRTGWVEGLGMAACSWFLGVESSMPEETRQMQALLRSPGLLLEHTAGSCSIKAAQLPTYQSRHVRHHHHAMCTQQRPPHAAGV